MKYFCSSVGVGLAPGEDLLAMERLVLIAMAVATAPATSSDPCYHRYFAPRSYSTTSLSVAKQSRSQLHLDLAFPITSSPLALTSHLLTFSSRHLYHLRFSRAKTRARRKDVGGQVNDIIIAQATSSARQYTSTTSHQTLHPPPIRLPLPSRCYRSPPPRHSLLHRSRNDTHHHV